MELAYWLVASLLALFYCYAGALKLLRSQEQLQPMMAWAGTDVPMPVVRLIGAVEVLGALGLVLPPLVGIATFLATSAAVGLVVLQVLAMGVHLRRGERTESLMNLALIVVAGVVVWLSTAL